MGVPLYSDNYVYNVIPRTIQVEIRKLSSTYNTRWEYCFWPCDESRHCWYSWKDEKVSRKEKAWGRREVYLYVKFELILIRSTESLSDRMSSPSTSTQAAATTRERVTRYRKRKREELAESYTSTLLVKLMLPRLSRTSATTALEQVASRKRNKRDECTGGNAAAENLMMKLAMDKYSNISIFLLTNI
jgi:hypothetical protein